MYQRINAASTIILLAGLVPLTLLVATSVSGAEDESANKPAVNYEDHVRAIFRQHCFTCHNQNSAESGLALDSYRGVIEGGSSGEVVFAEEPDSSRLWMLISHQEEPIMPPGQDKLADEKLAVISKWIELGMPENAGSKVATKKKKRNLAIQPVTGKPEGPAAMPENLPREPVLYTERPAAASAIAASPWAPLVALAGQQQVLLYHTETGELLGVLPFPEGIAYSLRFSRDGSKLLVGGGRGGYAGCAVLYDVKTGERLVKVGDELDAVLAADVNSELTRIALGGPGRIVRVFSTETGELLHEIKKHTDWIYAVRFSPDSVLLATADRSNGLFVWEANTAREYLDLRGHDQAVTAVAWRDDSNVLASASLDGTVRLWEMFDGKQVARANTHGGGANAVSFAHDGRVASVGRDRTAKLWDPGLKPLKTFPAFEEPALEVAITHDGRHVVAGDWAGQIKMWDTEQAKEVAQLPSNPPTLAMRIKDHQDELQAARKVAQQAAQTLAAVQQRVNQVKDEHDDAMKRAQARVDKIEQDIARAKADRAASVARVNSATARTQQAEQAVKEAQRALETATLQLKNAQALLTQATQREEAASQRVPAVEKQLRPAQNELDKIRKEGIAQVEKVAEEMPSRQQAAQQAQQEVQRLQKLIEHLEAQQTVSEPDAS